MAGRNRSDLRVRRSKDAVLATTMELVLEAGLGGASIDEISARSGVAKTTIYRHWPDRTALLLDACSRLGPKLVAPNTGSLKGDLMALASDIARHLRARQARIVPSIMDAAERDRKTAALFGNLHAEVMSAFRTVIERARRERELPRTRDASDIVALVAGPIFYRRWFSRERIDERFVRDVVDSALGKLS